MIVMFRKVKIVCRMFEIGLKLYTSARKVVAPPTNRGLFTNNFLLYTSLHTDPMAPQRRLKGYERLEIIGAHNARVPLKEIARNIGIPPSTVRRTVRKSRVRNKWQYDLPRSGRPRESTPTQDNRIYRHLRINNNLRWSEIEELASIKRTQIRQRLHEIDPNFR